MHTYPQITAQAVMGCVKPGVYSLGVQWFLVIYCQVYENYEILAWQIYESIMGRWSVCKIIRFWKKGELLFNHSINQPHYFNIEYNQNYSSFFSITIL